jgi:hypothetical protein
MHQDVREQELLHILHSLKPQAIEMWEGILEDSAMLKEGLQPYLVKKLDTRYHNDLEKVLSIVTPSDELKLVVINDSILSKEQIRAIESLGLKRLEIQSLYISRELLEQVNAIKVQKKCVTGESENKEVWSEEVIASYGHLFRKGDEPQL